MKPEQESRRARFEDRVAIVTGGGTGIGRATAIAFAQEGAKVLVVGRRAAPLTELAWSYASIAGHPDDLADPAASARVVEDAVARWGRVDVLVNNAATIKLTPLAAVRAADLAETMTVNVISPTLLASAANEHLARRQGAIVNVSTIFAHATSPPRTSYYGASKAALEALTRSWALELAPAGIRVNAIAPGPTDTGALERSELPADAISQIKQAEIAATPLGRRGRPDEIADWILHLASPSSAWVTGQVIDIDGGIGLVGHPSAKPSRTPDVDHATSDRHRPECRIDA